MTEHNSRYFERNFGFYSREEQDRLKQANIAIGGVGGDGFLLGTRLASSFGLNQITVADPEVFEAENTNRVPFANEDTIDRKKVDVFHDVVSRVRPKLKVRLFDEGVTVDNVDTFMEGADIVFDETELTHPEVGVAIARAARERNIPNILVMNIGFAAVVTSFHPQSPNTFEKMMGFTDTMPLDEIAQRGVDFGKCLPYIPGYGDMNTLMKVRDGASLPSLSVGVDIASALGTTQAFLHLTHGQNHRKKPVVYPHWQVMDAYSLQARTIRSGPVSYRLGALSMAVRSKCGLNPRASY